MKRADVAGVQPPEGKMIGSGLQVSNLDVQSARARSD
jgi:hypothetical protein